MARTTRLAKDPTHPTQYRCGLFRYSSDVRTLYLLVALTLPTASFGFTEPSSGIELDLGTGLVQHAASPGFGWSASAMAWFGKHDDTYSLGKYYAIGPTIEHNLFSARPGMSISGEFRRGTDLLVLGIYSFASVGAQVNQDQTTIAIRAGGNVHLRTHVYWSTGLRLAIGADVTGDTIPFRASLLLVGTFARPFRKPRR